MKRMAYGLLAMVLILGFAAGAEASSIRDDATGGDCTLFGNWDAITKTCTFTQDALNLTDGISIDSNGITLDGNGHLLSSLPGGMAGIRAYHVAWVTIKNLRIENFSIGIEFNYGSASNTIIDNTIVIPGNGMGIALWYAWSNYIANNTVQGIYSYGVMQYYCGSNHIFNNTFGGTGWVGILFSESGWNTANNNTIQGQNTGVEITAHYRSQNNYIYNNNFIQNQTPAYSENGNNFFSLDAPAGGNYWDNYDTAEEGCIDINADGFCDVPHNIVGGIDYMPWTKLDGWLTPAELIENTTAQIQELLSSGEIASDATATSLTAVLDSALTAQAQGNEQAADQILTGFIHQVEGQERSGRITAEAATQLIDAANQVISK